MRLRERFDFAHDRALFETVRDLVPKPKGVETVVFEEGEDSDGDPASWIWVSVKPQSNPSKEWINILTEYTTRLRDELLDRGAQCFPYVRIAEYKPRVPAQHSATGG
jgi:hypothetical protein